MGVRPPADDSDEPDVVEFGIAALDARLGDADLEFPIDAVSLTNRVGHVEVPYDAAGHTMTVEEAVSRAETTEFENEQELLNALHPVFESRREATKNSIIAQLRGLVPF